MPAHVQAHVPAHAPPFFPENGNVRFVSALLAFELIFSARFRDFSLRIFFGKNKFPAERQKTFVHNAHCALCTMHNVHCAQCTMFIVHNAHIPCLHNAEGVTWGSYFRHFSTFFGLFRGCPRSVPMTFRHHRKVFPRGSRGVSDNFFRHFSDMFG